MDSLISIPPEITDKSSSFLMISGEIQVNWCAQICLICEAKFSYDPLLKTLFLCVDYLFQQDYWNLKYLRRIPQ